MQTPPNPQVSQRRGNSRRGIIIPGLAFALLLFTLWETRGAPPPGAPMPFRTQTNAPSALRIGRTNNPAAKAPISKAPEVSPLEKPARSPEAKLPPAKGPAPKTVATNAASGTNAAAFPKAGEQSKGFLAGLKERWIKLQSNPMAYSIGAVVVCAILALVLGVRALLRRKQPKAAEAGAIQRIGRTDAKISGCNVLMAAEDSRKLWVFDARSHGYSLNREYSAAPGEKLPRSVVSRSWRSIFQKKLNVALLSPEHVFLKVLQLPRSTHEEMLAMIELQVEKLSPMPLAQVVWGIQVLPRHEGSLDTVVVMIVSRVVVEEFLGRLEGEGYLADRLELPLLDQLQATPVTEDGACIYPFSATGRNIGLVAWWYGGTLNNLDLATLPATDQASSLREQLQQMTWAGELEGWVTSPPRWTVVASAEQAALWEGPLREGLEQEIRVLEPLSPGELAGRTAERAARSPLAASLMPLEFVQRYRQQFVDRLWMRGLAAVVALYVIGVLVYFVALGVATYRTSAVERKVANMGASYTNAMQLKAQSKVLQDRMDLKYAALDCWATVAKLLPGEEGLVLESLNFSDGKRLTLMGTARAEQTTTLLDFEAALRKANLGSQPLFGKIDNVSWNVNPGTAMLTWQLTAELRRTTEAGR